MERYQIIMTLNGDEPKGFEFGIETERDFCNAKKAFEKTKGVLGFIIEDSEKKEVINYWYGPTKSIYDAVADYKLPKEYLVYFEYYGHEEVIYLKNGEIKVVDDNNVSIRTFRKKRANIKQSVRKKTKLPV